MQTAVATQMFIQIGRRRYQVASFEQASQMYCAARDAHDRATGWGASKTPTASIVDEHGKPVAFVSYNGRVWADDPRSRDWKPGATPLYDNREAA